MFPFPRNPNGIPIPPHPNFPRPVGMPPGHPGSNPPNHPQVIGIPVPVPQLFTLPTVPIMGAPPRQPPPYFLPNSGPMMPMPIPGNPPLGAPVPRPIVPVTATPQVISAAPVLHTTIANLNPTVGCGIFLGGSQVDETVDKFTAAINTLNQQIFSGNMTAGLPIILFIGILIYHYLYIIFQETSPMTWMRTNLCAFWNVVAVYTSGCVHAIL
jgi:hypothetical protein